MAGIEPASEKFDL